MIFILTISRNQIIYVCNKQSAHKSCTHIHYIGECHYLDNMTLKLQWNTVPMTSDQGFLGGGGQKI